MNVIVESAIDEAVKHGFLQSPAVGMAVSMASDLGQGEPIDERRIQQLQSCIRAETPGSGEAASERFKYALDAAECVLQAAKGRSQHAEMLAKRALQGLEKGGR